MRVLKYGRKPNLAFKPRLQLESTGFCPAGQWVGVMFKPGIVVGLLTIRELPTVELAVAHYFSELKRCGHVAVE